MKEELELDPKPLSWARNGSGFQVENSRSNGLEAACLWSEVSDKCHLEDVCIDRGKHDFHVLANLSLPLPLFPSPAAATGKRCWRFSGIQKMCQPKLYNAEKGCCCKAQGGSESPRTVVRDPLIPS